jgi:hypothetical protein
VSTWTTALDEFEARLEAQRAALDAGDAGQVAPFLPPDDLGPLPDHLLPRAQALLVGSRDLEEELAGNVQTLGQDLAVVRTIGTSTARPAQANFVDFSA